MSPQGGGGSSPPSPTKKIPARQAFDAAPVIVCGASVVRPAVDEQPNDEPSRSGAPCQVVTPAHLVRRARRPPAHGWLACRGLDRNALWLGLRCRRLDTPTRPWARIVRERLRWTQGMVVLVVDV